MKIGILGAGSVGASLAELAKNAGHDVRIAERNPRAPRVDFLEAASFGEIVIIAIPYKAVDSVLPALQVALADKIVIDATNPLNDDWSPLIVGAESSAGEEIAKTLPNSILVKAFNTVFADTMNAEGLERNGDKVTGFVATDSLDAWESVASLQTSMGFNPVYTGGLQNARYLEAMAHLNISIAVGQGGGTKAAFIYNQR